MARVLASGFVAFELVVVVAAVVFLLLVVGRGEEGEEPDL